MPEMTIIGNVQYQSADVITNRRSEKVQKELTPIFLDFVVPIVLDYLRDPDDDLVYDEDFIGRMDKVNVEAGDMYIPSKNWYFSNKTQQYVNLNADAPKTN